MSASDRSPRWALLALTLLSARVGAADDVDLARCAAIIAADARLACYDRLVGRRAGAAQSVSGAASLGVAREAHAAAPVVLLAPPRAALSAASSEEEFGLTRVHVHTAQEEVQAIQAKIRQVSADRTGHTFCELDNGQTWTFAEEDVRLARGDTVTIKRASLGSFTMLTPSHHAHKTRRIK